jgi:poly(beta-D-mannuronate) lyase
MKHFSTLAIIILCACAPAPAQYYPPGDPRPVSPLTLTIAGNGSVTPNLNNRLLKVGATYTLTARPAAGYIFADWTGGLTATAPRLTFVMQSNLLLQANFIPSPFAPVAGRYAGLISAGNNASAASSGLFTGSLTDRGMLTARLILAGKTHALKGQFTAGGSYSNQIARKGLIPLTVQLQVDFAGAHQITGSVSDGTFISQLAANRAVFSSTTNPAPQSGLTYTFVISPREYSPTSPAGHGFGTLKVDAAGNLKLRGTLADGTKFAQQTFVSRDGAWPLFASLQGGKNLVLGEMRFTNAPAPDLLGTLSWFKPPQLTARYYPGGFALPQSLDLIGSQYTFTPGQPVLTLTNGGAVILRNIGNGNLPALMITNTFTIAANNRVTAAAGLSLKIQPTTGLFTGRMLDPDTQRFLPFNGVLLQSQNAGYGYFTADTQTGSATVGPADPAGPPGNTNNPPEPPAATLPSRVLNLDDWKLTLPVDTPRPESPDEILQPALDKFRDPNFFAVTPAGDAVAFTAPCGGATTSGADYARSELREMENDGRSEASWSTTSGTHTMEFTQAITHLPVAKPEVVAGQIHDADDDVLVIRLENRHLFVDENGGRGPTLTSNYRLGDKFTVKFIAATGGIQVWYNGRFIYTYNVSATGCYFKAGCYTQSNTSRGDLPSAYGQVVIYNLSVTHR